MDKASASDRRPVPSSTFLYRIAIHEAGHAVVRIRLGIGTLERITIGLDRERGGGVSWVPGDDGEATEGRLTDELVATLAGRAAEEVIVGTVSAYSGGPEFSDLAQANDLALRMETVLGFSRKWPLLHMPTTDRSMLLTLDKRLAARIHQRLQQAYDEARALVTRQEEAVKYVAAMILFDRPLEGQSLTASSSAPGRSWCYEDLGAVRPASGIRAAVGAARHSGRGRMRDGGRPVPWSRKRRPVAGENIGRAMPCVYVAGNHEFYRGSIVGGLEQGRQAAQGFANVHFLENGAVAIGGVRFLGATLWTDCCVEGHQQMAMMHARDRMNDYKAISLQKNPWRRFVPEAAARLHQQSREFLAAALADKSSPTVVVTHTHHLPHPQSIPERFAGDLLNAAYASDLSELIEAGRPTLWIHGHTHDSCDYRIGSTRIVCNPRGYGSENGSFDLERVVRL